MGKYSHAIPIEHNLPPGPLWPWKHNLEELEALEGSDAYNYSAQYNQAPTKKGGTIFKTEWWQYWKVLPEYIFKCIFADTALKDGELNDYTVFQCWSKNNGRIYLLDQWRDKVKSTELKRHFKDFWNKHKKETRSGKLRAAYIEDKASGIQLVQDLQREGGIPIIPVPRNRGESMVVRANNLCYWIKSGLVYLPEEAEWLYDFKVEFERFTFLMTHKNDDQISCALDAIQKMLIESSDYSNKSNTRKKLTLAPSRDSKLW